MKIGSLVECVETPHVKDPDYNAEIPTKGKIYTVRDVAKFEVGIGVVVHELQNKPYLFRDTGIMEPYFPIKIFRQVQPPIANIEKHIKENTLEVETVKTN